MNDETLTEQHIIRLVDLFYQRANADDSLRPIFAAAISDWETHHRIVVDFWSYALLKTDRYHGSPYALHARLPLKLADFDRWLELFRLSANDTLPPAAASQAIARAEHMSESFKVGMFFDYQPHKSKT